jgi:hypothetical protein
MGDAQRRKKLGIMPTPRVPKISNFSVKLQSEIKNSCIAAEVHNQDNHQTVSLQFHLYLINSKLYAEFACSRIDWAKYNWVGENISEISPIICILVSELPGFTPRQIDRHKL